MNAIWSGCAPPLWEIASGSRTLLTTHDPRPTTDDSRLRPDNSRLVLHQRQNPVVCARRPPWCIVVQAIERCQTPEIDAGRRVVQHSAQFAVNTVTLFGVGLDRAGLNQRLRLRIVVPGEESSVGDDQTEQRVRVEQRAPCQEPQRSGLRVLPGGVERRRLDWLQLDVDTG